MHPFRTTVVSTGSTSSIREVLSCVPIDKPASSPGKRRFGPKPKYERDSPLTIVPISPDSFSLFFGPETVSCLSIAAQESFGD